MRLIRKLSFTIKMEAKKMKLKSCVAVIFSMIFIAGMLSVSAYAQQTIQPQFSTYMPQMTAAKDFFIYPYFPEGVVVGPGQNDFQVTKVDLNTGALLLNAGIDYNNQNDTPNAVFYDFTNNIYVTGQTNTDGLTVGLSSGGYPFWQKSFSANIGLALTTDPAVGTVFTAGSGPALVYVNAIDNYTGNLNWSKSAQFSALNASISYDGNTGSVIAVFGPANGANSIGLSYKFDGTLLAQASFLNNEVKDAALSPLGLFTAGSYGSSGVVELRDQNNFALLWRTVVQNAGFKAVSVSTQGQLVFAAGGNQIVALNSQNGAIIWQQSVTGASFNDISDFAFGNYVATVGDLNGSAYLDVRDFYTGGIYYDSTLPQGSFKLVTYYMDGAIYCAGDQNGQGLFAKYIPGAPPTTTIPSTTTTITPTTTTTTIPPTTTTTLPPTCEELLQQLINYVKAQNLKFGIETSLDKKLENALAALTDLKVKNNISVINRLQAFINEVEAQSSLLGPQLTQDFINRANAIIVCVNNNPY
jgi:hypothetical protein